MRRLPWALLVFTGLVAHFSPPVQAASDVQFGSIQDQAVSFTVTPGSKQIPPKPIKTSLFDLKHIGALSPHDGSMPYFLFSANPCESCSAERALYLIRPGVAPAAPTITSFVQPGKIFDTKSRALLMESRAFYGHCLAAGGHDANELDDAYIVFQKERVDRRHKLQTSIFIAQASPDFLREHLAERGLPPLTRTLGLVRTGKCHEIETRNRLTVLKPHGLTWRNLQPQEGDDEDTDSEPRDDVE